MLVHPHAVYYSKVDDCEHDGHRVDVAEVKHDTTNTSFLSYLIKLNRCISILPSACSDVRQVSVTAAMWGWGLIPVA